MTRFVMTPARAVDLALEAARLARGGEVFVFKMPVARLGDLVDASIRVFAPRAGRDPATVRRAPSPARPGEKPYEELMTAEESLRARDAGRHVRGAAGDRPADDGRAPPTRTPRPAGAAPTARTP